MYVQFDEHFGTLITLHIPIRELSITHNGRFTNNRNRNVLVRLFSLSIKCRKWALPKIAHDSLSPSIHLLPVYNHRLILLGATQIINFKLSRHKKFC